VQVLLDHRLPQTGESASSVSSQYVTLVRLRFADLNLGGFESPHMALAKHVTNPLPGKHDTGSTKHSQSRAPTANRARGNEWYLKGCSQHFSSSDVHGSVRQGPGSRAVSTHGLAGSSVQVHSCTGS
jgi:hypothetical protein